VTASVDFPAYAQLADEPALSAATWRVYMHCLTCLNLVEPCPIKVWAVAMELGVSESTARQALEWLIERRYLVGHGRGVRRVRTLRLAYTKAETTTAPL
jgi:hypothetical protein